MIKVGITHGDINGVGYEVILKAFGDNRMTEICTPIIYGSSKVAGYHRKALNLPAVPFNQISKAEDAIHDKINFINCISDDARVELGVSTDIANKAALQALAQASEDLENGLIDVLVTAPINKFSIEEEGIDFQGNSEYLESRFGSDDEKALLVMAQDNMRVALVTGRIPLSEVSANISLEKVIDVAKLFDTTLKRDFRVENPRIAILALNPLGGGQGKEEQEIIIPAIKELQGNNVLCFGPYASDEFFAGTDYHKFDGIIAMYYEQGVIPFKTLLMHEGVKYTAGLPIVHTSPSHETDYDIAGKGEESEDSLRHAIYLAIDAFKNRENYDIAYNNPLRKLYVARGSDNEELSLKETTPEE